jgi:hypothetical protein
MGHVPQMVCAYDLLYLVDETFTLTIGPGVDQAYPWMVGPPMSISFEKIVDSLVICNISDKEQIWNLSQVIVPPDRCYLG